SRNWFAPVPGGVAGAAHTTGEWLRIALVELLPIVTVALACLMVSRVKYAHVFTQIFTGRRNRLHIIQIVFAVAVAFLVREMAIPLIFGWFAFATPIRAFGRRTLMPMLRRIPGPWRKDRSAT